MTINPIRDDLEQYLQKHNLTKKYKKSKKLFEQDPFYPSLNTELLEPKTSTFSQVMKPRSKCINPDEETIY